MRRRQHDVMRFVNAVARVVHEAAHRNLGHPNKNIGDAFLLAWKIKPPSSEVSVGQLEDSVTRAGQTE